MTDNNNVVIGRAYYSKFDSANDLYTLDGVFGEYADMEHKKNRSRRWIKVSNLVPYKRISIKRYLNEKEV
ncbi:hypothetical protein [Pseudoalteromonas phage vB_PalP_Y7]|nr:hypothetical protein [Pseudoalteromonas phage vB_PalP_Y7]